MHVLEHPVKDARDVRVRRREIVAERDRLLARYALCEHVAVEIDLLKVREHCLSVLRHGEGAADLRDVVRSILGIV